MQKIKDFLKKFKKYPKLYSKILYCATVASKFKRFLRYGNSSAFSYKISKERREYEKAYSFAREVKFSVLVPLYNTPQNFLKEMIDSVKEQTYGNFELCLADGSDEQHNYVEEYCLGEAKKDSRIVYKRLSENKGISENTNECIKMATGEYIALFDHDDVLHPSALFECMKVICECDADYVYTDELTFLGKNKSNIISFHLKPDFAPDNLLANNYICHFSVFKASLIEKVGMFRSQYDGSQDHDMILRLTGAAKKVVHIPKILYFWRSHAKSVAMDLNSKPYAIMAGRTAVRDSLKSRGINAEVESSPVFLTVYKIKYEIIGNPKVSVIIQCNNNADAVKKCVDSIVEKTNYANYEILVISHDGFGDATSECYKKIGSYENVRIFDCECGGNYCAANNYAASKADGEYLLLLNGNTEIYDPDWMKELIMYAQRQDVGAVGAKILSADNKVWHGGIILGLGEHGAADLSHQGADVTNTGYFGKMFYSQNVSAVASDCLMVKKVDYYGVGGFDEQQNEIYYDVDFCLKLRQKGLLNVFNPYSSLYRYASVTVKQTNVEKQVRQFKEKWKNEIEKGDPYYNPNLSLKNSYLFDFKEQ